MKPPGTTALYPALTNCTPLLRGVSLPHWQCPETLPSNHIKRFLPTFKSWTPQISSVTTAKSLTSSSQSNFSPAGSLLSTLMPLYNSASLTHQNIASSHLCCSLSRAGHPLQYLHSHRNPCHCCFKSYTNSSSTTTSVTSFPLWCLGNRHRKTTNKTHFTFYFL